MLPNKEKKKLKKKRHQILRIQQVQFCDSSGNPLASAWDLKIVYIPVEFLGKSRALCALKTMAYGDQLPNCATERRQGQRGSCQRDWAWPAFLNACLPVCSLELKLTLVQNYTDSCLLSHSWAWKKLAALPLVTDNNNCWQYLQIIRVQLVPGQAR